MNFKAEIRLKAYDQNVRDHFGVTKNWQFNWLTDPNRKTLPVDKVIKLANYLDMYWQDLFEKPNDFYC